MAKRVAVLVRERQEEALRVALGLTLATDRVEVFVLDRTLAATPQVAEFLAELRAQGTRLATTCAEDPGLEVLTVAQLARQLAGCDVVVAY